MSSARILSESEIDSAIGLPSEICGFKNGVYYPPKSFLGFKSHKNNCYNGLFYLLGDFQNSKDFKVYKTKHYPNENQNNPLIIQLYISICGILEELRKYPRTVFSKKDEYSAPYKGKINLSKTIILNKGLNYKTYKTINELNTRSIERDFLSIAFLKIPSLIEKYISAESKSALKKIINECNYHLQEYSIENSDLKSLTSQILLKRIESNENSRLLSHCKIVAEFLSLNSNFNVNNDRFESGNVKYNDFHLNLNRPFEKLLKEICKKLPQSPIPDKKFSEIQSLSGSLKHTLIPDVYGELNISADGNNTEPCLLIFDAKHKEFANLNEALIENDPFVQYNRISRNDLHQLLTYIRTNLINNIEGIFGFFGFIQEELLNNEFVDYCSPFIDCNRDSRNFPNPMTLKVPFEKFERSIFINILGLRFGSVLSLIGEACNDLNGSPRLLDDIYSRLAIELVSSLYADDVIKKNQTFRKTLNNCLDGASRSLFYVYRKTKRHLLEIGIHFIKHFIRSSNPIQIIDLKTSIIINGKSTQFAAFKISEKSVLYIIDSDEDPSRIFDSNRGSNLYENEYEVVTIISRTSVSCFKNGNGENFDILLIS